MQDARAQSKWEDEERFWRDNFSLRPYTASAPDYSVWEGAYRYGFEAAHRHGGRRWDDVEPELSRGWNSYEHRGASAWDHVKHAVRDAWERVTPK